MKHTKDTQKHFRAVEAARDFFEDLAESRQGLYDKRSEKWQESEAGEKALAEVQELEGLRDRLQETFDEFESIFELD